MRNPYAYEDLMDELGVDRYSDIPPADQIEARRKAQAPVIEAESPHVHMVHYSSCQDDGRALIISWCGVALDEHGQRDAGSLDGDGEMCGRCVAVIQADGACPACGTTVPDLLAEED